VLIGNAPNVYQDGKTLANVSKTLSAKGLDNGNAYGFNVPGKTGMIKLPQYFLDSTAGKNEIQELDAPKVLAKSTFTKSDQKSTFVYQYPSWWDASPKASSDFTTQLNDGSVVEYRWYKFVDQPALQRFELNETEKAALQSAVIKMQTDWAKAPMMANPSKGNLVSFDEGLLASPPKGLEYGYVPIVIKQYMGSSPIKVTPSPTPSPSLTSPTNIAAETNATAEAVPVKAVTKTTTIICVKGKLTKRVTAVKPSCPAGYKKK
jgi:hypothetical protein